MHFNLTNQQLAARLDSFSKSLDEVSVEFDAENLLREAARRIREREYERPRVGIEINEDMLFWGFRYCLSRRSYAVDDGVKSIVTNWNYLSQDMRKKIKLEIMQHMDSFGEGMMQCDKDAWARILILKV